MITGGGVGRRGECKTKGGAYRTRAYAESRADWMADKLGFYRPGLHIYRCSRKACRKFHIAKNLPKDWRGRRL